jgi:hypothetical protein
MTTPPIPPQPFSPPPVPPAGSSVPGPYPPQSQTFPGAPQPMFAPEPQKRPWFRHPRIIGAAATLLVVAAVAVGGAIYQNLKTSPYQVGTCIHEKSSTSIESVKCDSADASYEIVARYNEAEPFLGTGSCDSVAASDTAWWEGTKGKTGLLLCLKTVK